MTRMPRKTLLIMAAVLVVLIVIAIAIKMANLRAPGSNPPITLEGSVLQANTDPSDRTPLSDVTITASNVTTVVLGKSDPTGYFRLIWDRSGRTEGPLTLTFESPNYRKRKIDATRPGDQLYIVQMYPLQSDSEATSTAAEVPATWTLIKNVRVRYSFKGASTIPVGSIAKQFLAHNIGNTPCRGRLPCSPDGRWKATITNLPLDADVENEFRNLRISCIAGPCHFTRIRPDTVERPGRRITVSVLNWSDTTAFLAEADVTRTMVTEQVRQSYPFLLGDTMSFALPPSSQGPSIEANLDGEPIVFPLGPRLFLSWATCSVEVSKDGNKIYRCQLKPGYRFQI